MTADAALCTRYPILRPDRSPPVEHGKQITRRHQNNIGRLFGIVEVTPPRGSGERAACTSGAEINWRVTDIHRCRRTEPHLSAGTQDPVWRRLRVRDLAPADNGPQELTEPSRAQQATGRRRARPGEHTDRNVPRTDLV